MDLVGEDSLKQFAKKYPNARPGLDRWLKLTKAAQWKSLQDLKATFPATDYIPQSLYCFDIGGNNYRLLTAVSFQLGVVTVLDFMTHAEYDKKILNTR
ncbi:MAG: type II toxin-antitoxin system HigB family toxin [Candidatus Melainabacteria bacterium]|nr:type II toxin-antitoxin system HigB family toxin [Candidatus Melainabacteria bacterium]